jgi:RNA polymerase sigma factor (sigma-70 family)
MFLHRSKLTGGDLGVGSTAGRKPTEDARKRAAVEVLTRYESALRRTARRYSLCAEDAEDAFQRALEILLTKAPSTDPQELIRWTQTVTKHEALAIRRSRERTMGRVVPPPGDGEQMDWVALIPAEGDGPDERAEREEAIARSREALRALKPAERRALGLLAGGCSYAEIAEITGFSPTKVNRSIAEGRERFRRFLAGSEDGSRCAELRPLLSAFCDSEVGPEQATALRDHLRACGSCRAAMRAYRATPGAVAALAPAPFALAALLERAQAGVAKLTATTKAAAVSAGTAAVGTACILTGVVPVPFSAGEGPPAAIERGEGQGVGVASPAVGGTGAGRQAKRPQRRGPRERTEREAAVGGEPAPVEYAPAPEAAPAPALEPAPEPAPAAAAPEAPASSPSGNAAGEFGP